MFCTKIQKKKWGKKNQRKDHKDGNLPLDWLPLLSETNVAQSEDWFMMVVQTEKSPLHRWGWNKRNPFEVCLSPKIIPWLDSELTEKESSDNGERLGLNVWECYSVVFQHELNSNIIQFSPYIVMVGCDEKVTISGERPTGSRQWSRSTTVTMVLASLIHQASYKKGPPCKMMISSAITITIHWTQWRPKLCKKTTRSKTLSRKKWFPKATEILTSQSPAPNHRW